MTDTVITVEGLSKRYRIGRAKGEKYSLGSRLVTPFHYLANTLRKEQEDEILWALKDISFEVKRGEVLGIIGRNGAGKSTLLKILSRITEPTSGRAVIRGRVGSLLEVGTGFHPELTGRENIFMSGAILGMHRSEIERRFEEIVEFAGVSRFLDTPVKRYSSGMYVRLGFAVAAHLDPEVLLVDEVLAVGDAEFQKKCLGKMGEVAKGGRTILFVSHNTLAIGNICDRAIMISNGSITNYGKADEVIQMYQTPTTIKVQTKISDRWDRQGGDLFHFTDLQFLDPSTGKECDVLASGEPVKIRIHYNSRSRDVIKGLEIGFGIHTLVGNHLFACMSGAVGRTLNISPGDGFTECELAKWPLKSGDYSIDLVAFRSREIFDRLKDALLFSIVDGDFYGFGKLPAQGEQGVLVEYQWRGG